MGRGSHHPGARQESGAGVTIWHSLEQLARSRRHARIIVVCLAVVAALWTAALSDGLGDGVLPGFIVLEVLTLSPLTVAALRWHHLSRQIREANRRGPVGPHPLDSAPDGDKETGKDKSEQLLDQIGEMVGSLGTGPLRDAGDDAIRQARGIALVRAQLVRRLNQLTGMKSLLDDRDAAGAVQESADACLQHLASVDRALDELAAAVARLVDSSGAGQIQDDLDEVRGATDRVAALSGAMDDLRASDLGTTGTVAAPGTTFNADQR